MTGRTPILTKSFRVGSAAVEGFLILTASGDGETLVVADASTDLLVGVAGSMGAPANGMVDVDLGGIGEVRFGGNVEHGDPLTANALGRAVTAVAEAGKLVRIIGFAMVDAVNGDIGGFLIAPGVLSKPAAA